MNQSSASTSRLLSGSLQIFLAEALLFPTGLITSAFLTRRLGAEGYGLLTLTATIVTFVEWCTSSMFFRTTVKFISEAEDWRPIGTTILRQHLLVGTAATLLVCLLGYPIATVMGEASLTTYLSLFALQILLFSTSRAHRNILTGLGRYSQGAIIGASRWLARMLLMILLVELGFSVNGAILGSVGASLVELVITRCYIRPSLFHRSPLPLNQLWNHAVPMFLYALSMHLYNKIDLILLKILGGTAQIAGIYGAAQNLSLVPSIFAMSLTPVLLSSLGQLRQNGNINQMKKLSVFAMRLVLLILPFASVAAGAAREIVNFIFGKDFLAADSLLAVLIYGSVALMMVSVATAILTAANKPKWTFILTVPMLTLAIIGHLLVIPKFSAIGAAYVTTFFAICGAIAAMLAVYRIWKIFPLPTLVRTVIVSGLMYVLAAYPSSGLWLLVKLSFITLLIPMFFLLLGEFSASEIRCLPLPFVQKLLRGK